MSESAYAYIPKSCETKSCKVHVAMHGCLQGYKEIKDDYYTETNYNDIADINDIIVLYPQAEVSKTVPLNPLGCWDFWGYSSTDQSNPDFYTREAPQMKAIVKMVKRLAEPRSQ
jgi:poly(3-hydroxybutyrate) depolymerase